MTDLQSAPGPTVLGDGKYVQLVKRGKWEFVRRKGISGIVAIVAVTDDEKLLLVEQRREAVGGRVIELPAGLAGDAAGHETEPLEAAARRELLEETGYEAGQFHRLTQGPPSAGVSDEIITLFRAVGLTKVGDPRGDGSESITLHEVPLPQIDHWLRDQMRQGLLVDLKIHAALHLLV